MQVVDFLSDMLDLAAFVFVTPDIIGRHKLDLYGRRLERSYQLTRESIAGRVVDWYRSGDYISKIAFRISLAFGVILMTPAFVAAFAPDAKVQHLAWVGFMMLAHYVQPFVVSFLVVCFAASIILVSSRLIPHILRFGFYLVRQYKFTGTLLWFGAFLFGLSRVIQLWHHAVS